MDLCHCRVFFYGFPVKYLDPVLYFLWRLWYDRSQNPLERGRFIVTIFRDISFLWSMLHVVGLFLLLFEPRYSWRTTFIAGFAGAGTLLVFNVLAMFWMGHSIIMHIAFFTCTIPTLLLFFGLSKYRDGRFFFLFCLSDTICFWLLQITNFLDRLAGDTYLVMLISRIIIFPAAELFFWKYLRRPYLALQSKLAGRWWLFTAIGATYYLLIMVTSVPVGTPMPDMVGLFRIILVMILMPLTYMTILHSLWRQMQAYESHRQIELQRRNYQAICQKIELDRIYRHDMRHHMVTVEGMLQQGNSQGAARYIQELSGKLTQRTQVVWSANSAINAVLTAYISQAEDSGCQVEADIHVPEVLPYEEIDLCIILANTLENAVNACRNMAEGQRDISIKMMLTENDRFILSINNCCSKPEQLDANGLPVTPYSAEKHGWGLRSVRVVADTYNGLLGGKWENGRYYLNIVLFPQKCSGTEQAAEKMVYGTGR